MLKFVTRRAWIDLVARVEKLEAAVLEASYRPAALEARPPVELRPIIRQAAHGRAIPRRRVGDRGKLRKAGSAETAPDPPPPPLGPAAGRWLPLFPPTQSPPMALKCN